MNYTFSCGHKSEEYGQFEAGKVIYCTICKENVSIVEVKQ